MSNSQVEFVLVPTRRDTLTKSLTVVPGEWEAALAMSRRNGYFPPDVGGLGRDAVRWFSRALRSAVAGVADAASRGSVERLIAFCAGDGACGFVLERRWPRAN
jgi:hypothetical protein